MNHNTLNLCVCVHVYAGAVCKHNWYGCNRQYVAYNVKFYAGLITVFDPRLVPSSLFMWLLVFNTQQIRGNEKATQNVRKRRAWKQECVFYLILWLCHIDLLMCWMGTQNEDRVMLLIYRTDIFKMATDSSVRWFSQKQ